MTRTPRQQPGGGTNLSPIGDFNKMAVLYAIRRSPEGLSRVELAGVTGLSAQTVSNIVRRLLEQSLVVESGKVQRGPGKPRTVLRIARGARCAVGVHLDPAVLTFVVLDLTGDVVARRTQKTPRALGPEATVELMGTVVASMLDDEGIDHADVVGVGLAAPGPLDPELGVLHEPPHLRNWHAVPLRESLSRRTGLPVALEKDVAAAAVAERWGAQRDTPGDFVFVYLGTGIGMGLVVDGNVVRGRSDNAGEVGHIVVDPDGPACSCGLRGCVAVTCVPARLVAEAEAMGVIPVGRRPGDPPDVEAALTALGTAADTDPAARAVLERSARRVAKAVSVLTNALDFDRVVLGGPSWPALAATYLDVVPEALEELMVSASVHPVHVSGTVFGTDVAAVGAACSVFDDAVSPQSRRLLLNR